MSTVSKNLFWSIVITLFQVYTGSIVFIVLAKIMPVNDFGILSYGYSFSSIISVCSDFGFWLMVMKDYPNVIDPYRYVFNSLVVKVIISILVGILSLFYLILFYENHWITVGGIFILFAASSSFILYFQVLLKIQNKFKVYAGTSIIYAIGITFIILLYSISGMALVTLAFFILTARVAQLLWCMYLSWDSFNFKSFNIRLQKSLFKRSRPFGTHMVLGILYFMIDTQFISIYLGANDVALYQSVFRIIFVVLMIPEMISNVLLPYISSKYSNKVDISSLSSKVFLYLLIIGCSLFLFLTTFREFLPSIYSMDYVNAIPLVIPFSLVVILRGLSGLLGNILTISNYQFQRAMSVFVTLMICIVLNFAFIPIFGIIAAAWNSVVVHAILFILYLIYCNRGKVKVDFLSGDVIIVLVVTGIIFIGINTFENMGNFVPLIGIVFWISYVYFIMSRNNNFTFLTSLLKERGV